MRTRWLVTGLTIFAFACSDDAVLTAPGDSEGLTTAKGPQGAQKVTLYGQNAFTCQGGGVPTAIVGGFTILNVHDGVVTANVQVKKVTPNQTYTVWLNQDPGDCPTTPTGQFTTNRVGNGGTFVTEAVAPGATHFWVSVVSEPFTGEFYRSPSAQLE
jgi:hypothetical protein